MGTRYAGSKSEKRALNTYIALMRAAETVCARASAHLAEHDLTVSQFGVLEALLHLGPLCQKDLAQKILKSPGNLTTVVDNLEKRGLVRREQPEGDRRYRHVALTDDGRALVERALPEHVESVRREMSALSGTELDELRALAKKLGKR